jgi:hypothetical protein
MSEFDKKALQAMNEALNQFAATVLGVDGLDPLEAYREYNQGLAVALGTAGLTDKDGEPVLFELKTGRSTYRYYQHKGKKRRYCYTPWADTKGRYWAFDITGRGTIVLAVKFRKRKAAASRALSRYTKAGD